MEPLTHKDVLEAFKYNPVTGSLVWRIRPSARTFAGDIAGSVKDGGGRGLFYLNIGYRKKVYKAHRLVWMYVNGEWPFGNIDHLDGNGLNNTMVNLRAVTHSVNMKNQRLRSDNTSGVRGVTFIKRARKWEAHLTGNKGTLIHLGHFNNKADAVYARKAAEQEHGYLPQRTHEHNVNFDGGL